MKFLLILTMSIFTEGTVRPAASIATQLMESREGCHKAAQVWTDTLVEVDAGRWFNIGRREAKGTSTIVVTREAICVRDAL